MQSAPNSALRSPLVTSCGRSGLPRASPESHASGCHWIFGSTTSRGAACPPPAVDGIDRSAIGARCLSSRDVPYVQRLCAGVRSSAKDVGSAHTLENVCQIVSVKEPQFSYMIETNIEHRSCSAEEIRSCAEHACKTRTLQPQRHFVPAMRKTPRPSATCGGRARRRVGARCPPNEMVFIQWAPE